MKNNINQVTLFSFCLIIIVSLCSWGFYVHETATQLAVYELPKQLRQFFFVHIDSVAAHAIQPDVRRTIDKTEAPKHFIDIENYGTDAINNMPRNWRDAVAKYSRDSLKKNGYVPYQILFEYDSLVTAFKQKNTDRIIFYADDLAHYIEDANVPLHTSNNYDGQLTGQKGLHALWESTIPQLEISMYNLHPKHKATYIKDKSVVVWKAVKQAHDLLPELFEKEKEVAKNFTGSSKYIEKMYYGKKTKVYTDEFARQYAAALGSSINNQLVNSVNMVADFWFSAWVDAGKPGLKSLYHLSKKSRKQLRHELKLYRKNDLLKNNLIRAKKE